MIYFPNRLSCSLYGPLCTWNGTVTATANDRTLFVSSSEAGQQGRTSGEHGFASVDLHLDGKLLEWIGCGSEHTLVVLTPVGGRGKVWGLE